MRDSRIFVAIWCLSVAATCAAFVTHLAMRGRSVMYAYELGRARSEQGRLRETKRVLQVESSSYKTPERVETVARTLLGMDAPSSDRILPLTQLPKDQKAEEAAPAASVDGRVVHAEGTQSTARGEGQR